MSENEATTASATAATATAEKTEMVDTMASLYTSGLERLAEVQKRGIDMAVKPNGELLDAWKKVAQNVPGSAGMFMLDLASTAFNRFAETQKGAVDLVLEQSHALVGQMKERAASVDRTFEGTPGVVQQVVEQSVAAQKRALDVSAAQTKAAVVNAKEQFGLGGTSAEAAESFQRGMESLVESQKELLDMAARPFTSATN